MSKILKNIYIDNKKYDMPDISGEVLTKDNTTQFIPTGDYNPATKKYVDDTVASAKSSGATAPSNPTEGQLWYDTANDQLKVYDGTNWNEVGNDAANINTKTFQLSGKTGTQAFNQAQQIVNYRESGGYPLVFYGLRTYTISQWHSNTFSSTSHGLGFVAYDDKSADQGAYYITITFNPSDNNTVTAITDGYDSISKNVLTKTNTNSYTPSSNYHPATKKYVDDSISTAVASAIVYVTQAEYDALPSTKLTDGKHYFIYE